MDFLRILWDDPDDMAGNVEHIAEHGLSMDDVEDVLENPSSEGHSQTSGLPCVWGYTLEGQYILVVYEEIDEDSIRVITAWTFPAKVPVERTPSSVRAKFDMTLTNGRRRPFYDFGAARLLSETSAEEVPEPR